jgi:hypothetical protein
MHIWTNNNKYANTYLSLYVCMSITWLARIEVLRSRDPKPAPARLPAISEYASTDAFVGKELVFILTLVLVLVLASVLLLAVLLMFMFLFANVLISSIYKFKINKHFSKYVCIEILTINSHFLDAIYAIATAPPIHRHRR